MRQSGHLTWKVSSHFDVSVTLVLLEMSLANGEVGVEGVWADRRVDEGGAGAGR